MKCSYDPDHFARLCWLMQSRLGLRSKNKLSAAEGRIVPVVSGLLLTICAITYMCWFVFGNRFQRISTNIENGVFSGVLDSTVNQTDYRQLLFNRLRALQIDRVWFLQLVDASFSRRFPELAGEFLSDSKEENSFRLAWEELANQWLSRVQLLPPSTRERLGSLNAADWDKERSVLLQQGLSNSIIEELINLASKYLLVDSFDFQKPREPFLQLWHAAAIKSLSDVRIHAINPGFSRKKEFNLSVPPDESRLLSVHIPEGKRLELSIQGSPLMQMIIYDLSGNLLFNRTSLRDLSFDRNVQSVVKIIINNQGLSSDQVSFSFRYF